MIFSVPATSANLGPGFDCLGLSLSFRNFFSIVESHKQSIVVYGEGTNNPRFVQDNTFVRIFMQTYKKLGGNAEFSFTFHNNIPVSRGMGSSSAIIVGAIFSAYKMAKKIPNKQQILDLAFHYEKHPDNIVPATFGGFNASFIKTHCGDKKSMIMHIRQRMPQNVRSVMVIPNHAMATKKTRTILPKAYSMQDCVYNLSRASVLSLAFSMQKWDLLRESSMDKMHQNARMDTYPILFQVQKTALSNGALMSTLSGSGSSIFSLCYSDDASILSKKMSERFPKFRVLSLDFDNDGVKLEKG
ncbi:homoserine kinase [Helicobacter didelphidarum]|uniref:Homoserine kinase n=1 Tax=Helicobacter didelphidarum TaxID=2040648 RepID=A0A3D8IL10_9HELI|nr:homoserine kinase [Helicobacter didelphidarum]RDU65314.1 homoserine kinase [Helicobacter didelphidarum]